ncbi:helix-turn-helix transcriptional regulator [Parvularcula sp. ZS-1/3]|uniref:Helix-turn-helix transcriptional regulator n=1 Tax=Parvularcula mediterranea TaxID=2732508 RepID=A0A7Y3RLF0_9PROT|nr:AraC family transcriptional regulator [Parvularcula mediterranea]NNU16233.1 helix-turn-helix transcriptional regulator [Parvularcula mediterranea]
MSSKPTLCEPVALDPAIALRAETVSDAHGPAEERLFPHFHDAHEFIFFEQAKGTLHTLGGDYPISSGCIVYVPSMRFHDFSLEAGPRDWTVLHADAGLVAELLRKDGIAPPDDAFVLQAQGTERERFRTLIAWTAEALEGRCHSALPPRLFATLLAALMTSDDVHSTVPVQRETFRSRLRPALELVADTAHRTVSVEEAAARCHLSRHYFSRSFKQAFGSGFAEYERHYRLRRAALRISSSAQPISDIAYEHGFRSPSHFTASFHKRFGVTPSGFRASHEAPTSAEAFY